MHAAEKLSHSDRHNRKALEEDNKPASGVVAVYAEQKNRPLTKE